MNDSEEIMLVGLDDEIIGSETKIKVHEKGLLHRAFSVFIIDNDKMLLQKRNINKYHSGGLWTNACCSHQRKNESLEEAVYRRMFEELGIRCELKELFTFIYRTQFENGLTEYELDHVYFGHYSGEVNPSPDEIEKVKWENLDVLKKRVADKPEQFTYWFREVLPKFLELLDNEICA